MSYIFEILVHKDIKSRLCKYANKVEPTKANKKGETAYELLRRINPKTIRRPNPVKDHDDHYHLRLHCHSFACQEPRARMAEDNGC